MNYKLPTLLILIVTLALSGCLEPNPDMPPLESTITPITVTDVTDKYPFMLSANVGWYKIPDVNAQVGNENFYYKPINHKVYLLIDDIDTISLFEANEDLGTQKYYPNEFRINENYEKRLYEIELNPRAMNDNSHFQIISYRIDNDILLGHNR